MYATAQVTWLCACVRYITNQVHGVRSMLPCFSEFPGRSSIWQTPGSLSYERSTETPESVFYSCPLSF